MTEVEALWGSAEIDPHVRSDATARARRILANRPRLEQIARQSGVPWVVVGLIHDLQVGQHWGRDLATGAAMQGQSFEGSALAALRRRGLAGRTRWHSLDDIADALETFNGLGYRARGVPSPYLWAGTCHYSSGLFVAPGVYSAGALFRRPGGMTVLRALVDIDPNVLDIAVPPSGGAPVFADAPRAASGRAAVAALACLGAAGLAVLAGFQPVVPAVLVGLAAAGLITTIVNAGS